MVTLNSNPSRRRFLSTASAAIFALALATGVGTPKAAAAQSEPVRIGLIDLALSRHALREHEHVQVRQMTFWSSGYEEAKLQSRAHRMPHADVMAEAMAETFAALMPGQALRLYVASPILESPDGGQVLDLDQLAFAYDWFAAQGVKIVAQTFVGRDTPQLRAAMARAASHGLIVLASAGNGPNHNAVPPYPAAYPDVVSITTTALPDAFAQEEDVLRGLGIAGGRAAYVDYAVSAPVISPMALRKNPELAGLFGSSRATAVAAAILAAMSVQRKPKDTAEAIMLLERFTVPGMNGEQGVLDVKAVRAGITSVATTQPRPAI